MIESPIPSGGERAPPTEPHTAAHPRRDLEVDADAERPVDIDDADQADDAGETVDIPIEAPIEDVLEQRITVRFEDDAHLDTG